MLMSSKERMEKFKKLSEKYPILQDSEEISILTTKIFSLLQTNEIIEESFEKLEILMEKIYN